MHLITLSKIPFEVFALLGCYATLIVCYRRFKTSYWSRLQVSSSRGRNYVA